MYSCISQRSLQHLPCIDLQDFKTSGITVIEGSSVMVPEVLFRLCAASVISLERDAVFVDGGNSFNPYTPLKDSKILRRRVKKSTLTSSCRPRFHRIPDGSHRSFSRGTENTNTYIVFIHSIISVKEIQCFGKTIE